MSKVQLSADATPEVDRRERAAAVARATMALANWSLAALRHENALLHQRERALESQLRALTGGEPAPASLHGATASRLLVVSRRLAENTDTSFTKERVTTIAVDKKLLLTFVNIVRIDFARTWVHHVRRLGMTNWLVGATDPRALRLAPGSTPTLTLTLTPHPDPHPKANPHRSPAPSCEPSPLTLTPHPHPHPDADPDADGDGDSDEAGEGEGEGELEG